MLRTTPFHSRTGPLCLAHNWRRWAGHIAAGSYELTHEREYYAVRNSAALFDVSPLHKYAVQGPDAVRLLDRIVTRDVQACDVHQVLYTPWCNAEGKVMDDGTLARLDANSFRLTSAEPSYAWLVDNAFGLSVDVHDVTDSMGALALQGPNARLILDEVTDGAVGSVRFFRMTNATIAGVPVTVTRTGYTGDLGYEIWLDASQAEVVWDRLIAAGGPYGITPAGLIALDLARVEAGLILLDVDYVPAHRAIIEGRKSSPFELGLGWAVSANKGPFNGQAALARERAHPSDWSLMGLEVDWESLEELYGAVGLTPQLPAVTWRTSVPVYSSSGQVGYATSGCWSPILKKYIALAHIQGASKKVGTELRMEVTVEHQRRQARARVVEMPFFSPERKRITP